MKKYIKILLTLLCVLFLISNSYAKKEKRAQTGMPFLSLSLDARATAIGKAVTSLEGGAMSLFYNPASMSWFENMVNISAGQMNFIADINYQYGAVAFSPLNGEIGVFGLSILGIDYGDLKGTIKADNSQGYLDTGNFSPSAYAIGLGYSKALSNRFGVGGQVKYVYQNLIGGLREFDNNQESIGLDANLDVLAFDFGIFYKTGFKSLNFGMSVRNFSPEKEYIQESFQLPLSFEIGISMNIIDLTDVNPEKHSLLFSFDATHPRDIPEQLDFGLEYIFSELVSFRAGYTTPSEDEGISLGIGLNQQISDYYLGVDYAYTDFGSNFDEVHRFTLNFSF